MWQPVKIHNRNTKVAIRTNNLQGRNEKRVGIANGQRWVGAQAMRSTDLIRGTIYITKVDLIG